MLIDTFGFDYAIYVMLYFLFVLFLSSVTSSFGFVLQYRASLYLRLPWNSPSSPCLSPSSAGITGVTHRTWLIAIFLFCYFFEMGPHCVDLAGLEHPVWLVMVLNSWSPCLYCLYLCSVWILCQHLWCCVLPQSLPVSGHWCEYSNVGLRVSQLGLAWALFWRIDCQKIP